PPPSPPRPTLFPYTTLFRFQPPHAIWDRRHADAARIHDRCLHSAQHDARPDRHEYGSNRRVTRCPRVDERVTRRLLPYSWRSGRDRKSTRLNSSHLVISYAV